MMPNMKRHGADMLWNVGTCEEIEGGIKERLEGDTGRRIETDISTYKHAHTYKHALHTTVLLHKDSITHIRFHIHIQTQYPQTHLHTKMFLQTISPTIPFTRRCFYTQTLWHTHTTLSHKRFYAHTLLHTSTFTQTLLHIGPFTHTHTHPFHTHTNTFT